MKFTVCMPIHNEEKLLRYSLPSIYQLNPDEVVFIFDRCTDNSRNVAAQLAKRFGAEDISKFYDAPEPEDFAFRIAQVKRFGLTKSSNDFVLAVDADTIVDPGVRPEIDYGNHFPFLSFAKKDYPINWRNEIKKPLTYLKILQKDMLGFYGVSVSAQKECEDMENLKKITLGEDTHLQVSIAKKYPVKHFNSPESLHIRPRENPQLHYWRGVYYWKTAKRGFIKTVASAVISGRFGMIKGYIHARQGSRN